MASEKQIKANNKFTVKRNKIYELDEDAFSIGDAMKRGRTAQEFEAFKSMYNSKMKIETDLNDAERNFQSLSDNADEDAGFNAAQRCNEAENKYNEAMKKSNVIKAFIEYKSKKGK